MRVGMSEPARPWYRKRVGIFGIVLGVGAVLRAAGIGTPRGDVSPVQEAHAAHAAPTTAAAPPALPTRALSGSELAPSARAVLEHRYIREKSYRLTALAVAEPKPGWLALEIEVRGEEGLTAGTMRRSALREAREVIQALSSKPAFDAVYLYQVRVLLPGSDKYGRPVDIDAVGVALKASDAHQINWAGLSDKGFEALVADVGSLRIAPALRD